ncbi:ATP-binding protein [Nocardia salmonicida]|uniref:ATP-binding protein n=1 Tax=Nocardia salmonicida TaxID=53431 RepID=UPI0007A53C48|nr:ATP-binding protein [Nocardia salmonicida]
MVADPHDIHTREDLQQAVAELYRTAGISYQKLAGYQGVTASHNTIHGWVHGETFPQWGNLAPVLLVWGITAEKRGAWKDAHTRAEAEARARPGQPLAEVRDPFDLEVHEPITVAEPDGSMAVLPPYVVRAHDDRVAMVADRALAGSSGIAVLLGDSSTGKTRALWEALERLRAQGGWRLWHPQSFHKEELFEQLTKIGPRTVLWLNETQRYFLPLNEQERDRLADQLRVVLADIRRAPILILGSLWHKHYDTLCADPGSVARTVFESAAITVPPNFTGIDLEAMRAASGEDQRLAMAFARAENGMITQYLAGGPELVHFYDKQASVTERAVIEAAMDMVRMGHPNVLPFTLLRDIASYYMDDVTWDTLENNWFEAALAATSRRCKGARGPITPIRERPLISRIARERRGCARGVSGDSVYQLADYLDEHGRRTRAQITPPVGFWSAVAQSDPTDQHNLAYAAWNRGLYRDAAQLWKNASGCGHPLAPYELLIRLNTLFPDDRRPAEWAASHIPVDSAFDVVRLLHQLRKSGADGQVQVLLARDPGTHVALDDPFSLANLLGWLRDAGADEQVQVLLARDPGAHVALDDPTAVAVLLKQLREARADEQVQVLLARDPGAHVALDDPGRVAVLLDQLREAGAHRQVQSLSDRAAAHVAVNDPFSVSRLLSWLRVAGTDEQVQLLLARDLVADLSLDDPMAGLLLMHWQGAGAHEHVLAWLDRAVTHVAFDDSGPVAQLLSWLLMLGQDEHVQRLLARDPAAHVVIENPSGVSRLLSWMRDAGAHEQVQRLLARDPAAHVVIENPSGVRELLVQLRASGTDEQVQRLLARDPAAHVALEDINGVIELARALREVGAHEQARVLMDRTAAYVALDDPLAVSGLLMEWENDGAHERIQLLLDRDLAAWVTVDEFLLPVLLDWLWETGAHGHAQALSDRLPAEGVFSVFIKASPDVEERFRFGRDPAPEHTPAKPWSWDDLA